MANDIISSVFHTVTFRNVLGNKGLTVQKYVRAAYKQK